MKAGTFVLLVLLFPWVGHGHARCGCRHHVEPSEWRSALETELQRASDRTQRIAISPTMMRIVLEEASRELGALDPHARPLLVLEEAVRAELRLRLAHPLPRVKADCAGRSRSILAGGSESVCALEHINGWRNVSSQLRPTHPLPGGRTRTGRGSGGG